MNKIKQFCNWVIARFCKATIVPVAVVNEVKVVAPTTYTTTKHSTTTEPNTPVNANKGQAGKGNGKRNRPRSKSNKVNN